MTGPRTAVIGSGFIGGTLGRAFAAAGVPTVFGSRRPGDGTVPVGDAIAGAEIVVLALPAPAVPEFLQANGPALAGKLIVDATNRVGEPVAHHAAAVAEHAPGALYARAFNTLGGENFADPDFDGVAADMFFSAPESHRAAVERLIEAVGLRPVYVGADQDDVVDGVLRLWFALAVGQGHGRHLAFRTLGVG